MMSPMKLGARRLSFGPGPLDRVLERGRGHGRADGEKRNPGRTMNVYVRPSADTVGLALRHVWHQPRSLRRGAIGVGEQARTRRVVHLERLGVETVPASAGSVDENGSWRTMRNTPGGPDVGTS